MQMRQGDIWIESVDNVPDGAKKSRAKTRFILARGEATGHHHSVIVAPDVTMYEKDGTLYLRVERESGVAVEHQEHAPINLPRGTFRVMRQREYSPEEILYVAD